MRAAIVLLALACATARADKIDPAVQAKADALFEKGQAKYLADEFQAAIELFKQAYELVHDPVYLFNIAQSYRKAADCEGAFDYYTRYLEAAPKAENRAKVEGWLREMQPCVEQRRQEHEAARRGEEAERQRRAEEERRRQEALAHPPPRVAAAAGIALYVVGRHRVEHVMVAPTDGGAAVSAQLRF
jgi:tetratricopeptide (TPR) repeat protein